VDDLSGGDGWDLLTGGGGADSFVFVAGEIGLDKIADFKLGVDSIELVGFQDGTEVMLMEYLGRTALCVGEEHVANLWEIDSADFDGEAHVRFVDSSPFDLEV
jgi:hypothetical protein